MVRKLGILAGGLAYWALLKTKCSALPMYSIVVSEIAITVKQVKKQSRLVLLYYYIRKKYILNITI